jgi:GTP cyclohydrolase IA
VQSAIEQAMRDMLGALVPGWEHDPDLMETPQRVARMYVRELCAGLTTPRPELAAFPAPAGMDQMIVVGPIVVHGLCPHHLAPIVGQAWVGVLPGQTLLGLSKYSRLVRWCVARPMIQEKTTELIADELARALPDAIGLAVVMRAEHLCMKWRGVCEPQAVTTTSAVRGQFLTDAATRGEFLRFLGNVP